ncbi:MAG: hypothetical protein M3016_06985 [Actinomycetota bacterium]|nr:hypothetical protein [Actinomycetota bacterium]
MVALVLAASGTAIAASHLVRGDKLIKKRSLSGNRLRNHTITGKQVNLKKLGKVRNARNADFATHATTATNATNATNATSATNVSGLTRFRKTIQPSSGTSFNGAAFTVLGTSGPISLVGKCYVNAGNINGGLFLTTSAPAQYNAYSSTSSSPLTPGTDQDVGNQDASSTPPAVDFRDPYDGTFSAITNNTSNYITGLASVGTNLNNSGGCTFAGFTSSS